MSQTKKDKDLEKGTLGLSGSRRKQTKISSGAIDYYEDHVFLYIEDAKADSENSTWVYQLVRDSENNIWVYQLVRESE